MKELKLLVTVKHPMGFAVDKIKEGVQKALEANPDPRYAKVEYKVEYAFPPHR